MTSEGLNVLIAMSNVMLIGATQIGAASTWPTSAAARLAGGSSRGDHADRGGVSDTHTALGGLVRLIVHEGKVVGATVIACPHPWVYRKAYLVLEDVD